MSNILPINIHDLFQGPGVESARVEYKAGWDEKTTGYQVLKTICAFANDFQNLNGGYVVIGIEENNGRAVLPPRGLTGAELDKAQKWIAGHTAAMDPPYHPILSPEEIEGRPILVIWAPGSDYRPHRTQKSEGDREKSYFVRVGSTTQNASKKPLLLEALMQQTAKVPFDDQRNLKADLEDIREGKVWEFLKDIQSQLSELDKKQLYRKMRISEPINGHDVPKNIGLLFFSRFADEWFPGAKIEIAQFSDDRSGDVIEEKTFRGGIHETLMQAISYLENLSSTHLEKTSTSYRVKGWISYPAPALREALANAVYHRDYQSSQDPIKVYLYQNRIEIISYPGPVSGIEIEHLEQNTPMPPVPARNRRIGEFLKELRLAEGRGTGLPKLYRTMKENGSPDPKFDFDRDRTYFRVTLPAHPEYVAIAAMREAAHLRAIGKETAAFERIHSAWEHFQSSPSLTKELMQRYGEMQQVDAAINTFESFKGSGQASYIPTLQNVLIEILLSEKREDLASKYLENLSAESLGAEDILETAIHWRRLNKEQKACRIFEKLGDFLLKDPRGAHEFAQCKMRIAAEVFRKRKRTDHANNTNRTLLMEAKDLLERVIAMDSDSTRKAWAWRDLGKTKYWLKYPFSEVEKAYEKAAALFPPMEKHFLDELKYLAGRIPGTPKKSS